MVARLVIHIGTLGLDEWSIDLTALISQLSYT